MDTYLIWRLSDGRHHVTDATNASRTQLFDIHRQCWDEHLLSFHEIPAAIMPEVVDSAGQLGTVAAHWFGAELPICGVAGDQQAALVGQSCIDAGSSKATYGTGCFFMLNVGDTVPDAADGLLTTVAYRVDGQPTYALEGSIFVAGVALKWLRDQLQLITDPAQTQTAYEATGGDAGGVFVVPAFTGLGAPHWQPLATGLITGMTLDTTRDHVLTAFLQSIVLQTRELLAALPDEIELSVLRVDGGMVVNDSLCQCLADLTEVAVERPIDVESTARGAALLALLGAGVIDTAQLGTTRTVEQRFSCAMPAQQRQRLIDGFARAVRLALAAAAQ